MKIILTQKVAKLGNIGDVVTVATGFARNYLLPNGKAMRWSKENSAAFEAKKAVLLAEHEDAKSVAAANLPKIKAAKLHMIRSAGDTGHLYGSVSSRDIARMLTELTGIAIASEQILMGSPVKEIGKWETKVALHPDVVADIAIYVAQTQDEIEALVAGKSIKKDVRVLGSDMSEVKAKSEKKTEHENSAAEDLSAVAAAKAEETKSEKIEETAAEVLEESAE